MSELAEVIKRLEAEAAMGGPESGSKPDHLPLGSIKELHEAFQHRTLDPYHVGVLQKALKGGSALAPVVVFQAGSSVYLLDGHHRVAAYLREEWSRPVPVSFFAGTVAQAVAEAGRLNSQAKLPMTLKERNDLAWRLVNCPGFSKAQIVQAASVSDGQVAIMRRVRKALGEDAAEHESWYKAQRAAKGTMKAWEEGDIDAWLEAQAEAIAERLQKAFGPTPVRNPEVFAMALVKRFGDKIDELVRLLPQPVAYEHEHAPDDDF